MAKCLSKVKATIMSTEAHIDTWATTSKTRPTDPNEAESERDRKKSLLSCHPTSNPWWIYIVQKKVGNPPRSKEKALCKHERPKRTILRKRWEDEGQGKKIVLWSWSKTTICHFCSAHDSSSLSAQTDLNDVMAFNHQDLRSFTAWNRAWLDLCTNTFFEAQGRPRVEDVAKDEDRVKDTKCHQHLPKKKRLNHTFKTCLYLDTCLIERVSHFFLKKNWNRNQVASQPKAANNEGDDAVDPPFPLL